MDDEVVNPKEPEVDMAALEDDFAAEVASTTWTAMKVRWFVRSPSRVVPADQLMDAAYGEHIYVDDRTIDSHIKRLRKKFKDVDPEFEQVETLYGIGYRYREE